MLTKEELEKFRKQLLQQKVEIEKELKNYAQEFSYVPQDEEEIADEAEEFFTFEGIKEEEEEMIAKIDRALWKIEKGIFGICEKCGKEIELEVLNAAPESELCKSCKAEINRLENR